MYVSLLCVVCHWALIFKLFNVKGHGKVNKAHCRFWQDFSQVDINLETPIQKIHHHMAFWENVPQVHLSL